MSAKNKTERYVDHINGYILPFVDYSELQKSYETDMVYAKGILNRLHEEMVKIYGGETLDEQDGDDGMVVIPGVVRGIKTGKMSLALLELDLSSSGEHWDTSFLCEYGVIPQFSDPQKPTGAPAVAIKEISAAFVPYDYGYTARLPGDIHINKSRLPDALRDVLSDFKNHAALTAPVGRIDFLGTNGIIGESVEYTDAAKFEQDVKRENYSGAPMTITLYRGAGGQTIPHDFIYDIDPPPQGFYVEDYENKDEAEKIAGADDEDEWEP